MRLPPPAARRPLPVGRPGPVGRGARPAGRRLRARVRPRAACGLPVRRPEDVPRLPRPRAARRPRSATVATAAASRTASASCARSSRASGPQAPGLRVGVRLSAFDLPPYRKDETGHGVPERDARGYAHAFGVFAGDMDEALADARELLPLLRRAGHPLDLRHRWQPLLQPARAAAGALPAERRLPAAGGPAGRRRAPDRRHRPAQGRLPRHGVRRLGLQLPAGVAAQRRAGRGRAAAEPTPSASAGSFCRIPSCRPTCWPGGRSTASRLCRTFSDCTTAPRKGLPSGCYPLDRFYADRPEAEQLKAVKAELRS